MGIVFHPMTLVVLFSCKKNKTLAATIQIKKNIIPCKKARKPPTNSCRPFARIIYLVSNFELLHPERTHHQAVENTGSTGHAGNACFWSNFPPQKVPGAPWNTSITSPTSILLNWSLSSISRLSESTISLTTSVAAWLCE